MPYTLPNAKAEARRRMADTASPWAVFPLGADAYAVRPYSGARAYTDAMAPTWAAHVGAVEAWADGFNAAGFDMPPLPPGWTDSSYQNDVAPSYEVGRLRVWLFHPDPDERENHDAEGPRFAVSPLNDEGEIEGADLFASDDWAAVCAYVNAHPLRNERVSYDCD